MELSTKIGLEKVYQIAVLENSHIVVQKNKKNEEIFTQNTQCFTDQEKNFLLLYYFEKSTLKDISEVLDMTELDVNILLTMATMRLKEILND